ncbi:ROK family protein [Mycoplasma procyoni]|uniref:ROK family protein n=1 Tax=Mycoplasma procyoni TaxID=568784 RepID=UPI00197B9AB1|nr:ROK family protein [Mycoplasma procyoni]MBN3535119.1 ROK family protein [Mycoplasma procyoni]
MAQKLHNIASVDIGGTNVRFALVQDFKITKKIKFSTDQKNWKNTLDKLIELIKKYNITKLALCIPGPANYEQGKILKSPNLKGWTKIDLKSYLLENTDLQKIVFENDANAMALANHHYYKQTEKDVTQFFTVSTGFGAGLVINNKIYTGINHLAQEIARIPLGTNQDDVFHLSKYAAENFVSGTGIQLRASKLTNNPSLETKEIFENYTQNPVYKSVIDEAILSLAKTIATTIGFLAPNLIVFGGSVSNHNTWFIKEAIKVSKEFCDINQFKQVKFRFDKLKDNSALVGLNLLAKDL